MRPSLKLLSFVGALSMQPLAAAAAESAATVSLASPAFENAALTQAPGDDGMREQALVDKTAYEQTIAGLEARQGVYGVELSEAYVGLGNTLRKLEQNEDAAEAFGKALQSLRISYGLDDLRQLAVLEELRTTNEMIGNWDELHSTNHLIFRIASHNAEASAEVRLKAVLQLGHWIRKAYADKLVSEFEANPRDLSQLYDREIERLEASAPYEGKGIHLAALYLDLATTELSEAKRKYEMPISEFQTPGAGEQRTTMQQTCFSAVDRTGRTVQACTTPMEVPNINYYLAPNAQKQSEIRKHLGDVENQVLAAWQYLQDDESEASELKTALLGDVQRLTQEYNAFVSANRESTSVTR